MFAGPNGSGKTELIRHLPPKLLGIYFNPDEIERSVRLTGELDLAGLNIRTTEEEAIKHFTASPFLISGGFASNATELKFSNGKLDFRNVGMNSYFASVAVDFIREKLLSRQISFTFQTVMSHRRNIEWLKKAQSVGYQTYLYYVATDDPMINVSRVRARSTMGGVDVPEERVISNYYRSLELLNRTIPHTNRAYIFDNSSHANSRQQAWIAEIAEGREIEFKSAKIPVWFQRAVLDKRNSASSNQS